MKALRFRAWVKVLCENCQDKVNRKKRIDTHCKSCRFLEYSNVRDRDLRNFTRFLHRKFPNWIWFNTYEYVKGKKGQLIDSYVKGKSEPQ